MGRKTRDGMLASFCAMRDAQAIFHLPDDAMRGAEGALQCAGNALRTTRDTLQGAQGAMHLPEDVKPAHGADFLI